MVEKPSQDQGEQPVASAETEETLKALVFYLRFVALIAIALALYLAQSFFVPVLLALVFALTLNPLVDASAKIKVPRAISSAIILLAALSAMYVGVSYLAQPMQGLIQDAPQMGRELQFKLRSLRESVDQVNKVQEEVEKATESDDDPEIQRVRIVERGSVFDASDEILTIGASSVLTLVLTYFFLTTGDLVRWKMVRVMPKLKDKKHALMIAEEVERDVSRYLLTVSVINGCLGFAVGAAFYFLGMPNPILWGVIAGLLNFLPYVGSGIGILLSGAMAVLAFPLISQALLVPATYFFLTLLEGQFVTPVILGKRFSINTVAILLALAFAGFLWGAIGVFLAMPLLIILKAFCNHIEKLSVLGEFLSGRD